MPPTDLLATIKQKFSCDVDLDDFFNVRSGQALSTKNIDDRRNLSHKSIISRFKNPEIARVVNMKLLELEAIDENELIWLDGYLDGKLEEMRKYKKNKTEQ